MRIDLASQTKTRVSSVKFYMRYQAMPFLSEHLTPPPPPPTNHVAVWEENVRIQEDLLDLLVVH